MGAVTESGTLLIGTNTFAILTQSITDWVNFQQYDFGDMRAIRGDMEEYKSGDMSDYGQENYRQIDYDNPDYDVLEGQSLDGALEEIYQKEGMTLEELKKNQQAIVARDAQGAANNYSDDNY